MATTKTFSFECQDSGITLTVRKVPYTLSEEINKQYPAPPAPRVEVTYGTPETGIRVVQEENKADPDYQLILRAWRAESEKRLRKLIVTRGVVLDALTPDQLIQVQQLRDDMQQHGVTLDTDDKNVYLWHIAVATPEDYKDLVTFITRRSGVTEEGKAEAKDRFRGDVQG